MTQKEIYQKHDLASSKTYIDETMLYNCMNDWGEEKMKQFAIFLQQAGLTAYSAEWLIEQFKTFEV